MGRVTLKEQAVKIIRTACKIHIYSLGSCNGSLYMQFSNRAGCANTNISAYGTIHIAA